MYAGMHALSPAALHTTPQHMMIITIMSRVQGGDGTWSKCSLRKKGYRFMQRMSARRQ